MPVLHTINTLTDQYAALRDCVLTLEQNDAVVFMEEAAADLNISHLSHYQELLTCEYAVYILPFEANTPLQGKLAETVKVLSYNEFVDLCCRFSTIQNWY